MSDDWGFTIKAEDLANIVTAVEDITSEITPNLVDGRLEIRERCPAHIRMVICVLPAKRLCCTGSGFACNRVGAPMAIDVAKLKSVIKVAGQNDIMFRKDDVSLRYQVAKVSGPRGILVMGEGHRPVEVLRLPKAVSIDVHLKDFIAWFSALRKNCDLLTATVTPGPVLEFILDGDSDGDYHYHKVDEHFMSNVTTEAPVIKTATSKFGIEMIAAIIEQLPQGVVKVRIGNEYPIVFEYEKGSDPYIGGNLKIKHIIAPRIEDK